MKEYPRIDISVEYGIPGKCFYKYDGNQIRVEWTRKRGWDKQEY